MAPSVLCVFVLLLLEPSCTNFQHTLWQNSTNQQLKSWLLLQLPFISVCSETLHTLGILPSSLLCQICPAEFHRTSSCRHL